MTFSQSDLDLEDVESNLKLFFEEKKKDIEWYIIGRELHDDGGVHYHVVILLKDPYDCKNQFALDKIGGGDGEGGKDSEGVTIGHGKYETVRNKVKVIQYCIKDGEYVEEGIDANEYINCRAKNKSVVYATKLRDEEMTVKDIVKDDPGFYFSHKRKVDEYVQSVKKMKHEDEFKKHTNVDIKPYGWQSDAIKLIEKQGKREILWVYETEGKTGKSDLAKWLHANKGAYLIRGGKIVDITRGYDYEKLVVFDYPRESTEFINYSLIEMFKDGVIQSNKYDSHVKYQYGIKIVIFSNEKPDATKLSVDRILLYEIVDRKKLSRIKIN